MKCTCSKWGFFTWKHLPELHKWDSFFSDPLPYFKWAFKPFGKHAVLLSTSLTLIMCYFGSPRTFRLKAQISEISAGNVDKQALLKSYQAPKSASFKSSVSSAVFFFVHPNPSGRDRRLRAPHAPNSLNIKPWVSTQTVSGLTWALQGTKENTGGILPCWQPSQNPPARSLCQQGQSRCVPELGGAAHLLHPRYLFSFVPWEFEF